MSTIAHDTALASIVADAGPHDTPYLHPFHGCRLVDLLRVPRFQEEVAASPAELTAHEAAIHDRNNDMPLDGARVAIDHHDVVVVDASVDHARSADAEDETCRPIEPQQLDQAYGVVLPVLGRAWKAGSCCRSEEHTSELQSLMLISYAVFCLKKQTRTQTDNQLQYGT